MYICTYIYICIYIHIQIYLYLVHFVFHEHGLRNGGFGDRLAGLVTATAIALRFNRTLVIESGI
jgi:hypothetical protein